ncbi:hypothetical protein [Dyadobacter sp. CY312]|uniref:hypothetical protein n=1 Tax=Dyadobacter sp. CY312 TaxID=2907303 RepID=UPI001F1A57F7|nr:hypothetical protein [Dyadobacter sp. CY312]MCE7044248.1 hypothetical protein [Dyadobacter sp. CY312]
MGTFTIESEGNASLYLDDLVSAETGNLNVTVAPDQLAQVHLNGTTGQTLPVGLFVNNTVPALTVNNDMGITIQGPLTVTKDLTFAKGKLKLSSDNLVVGGTVIGADASKYVVTDGSGGLTINNVGNTNIVFPVGSSSSSYTPLTLSNSGDVDHFTVKTQSSLDGITIADPSRVVPVFWEVSEAVPGGSKVLLTLQWNAVDAAKFRWPICHGIE